MAYADDLTILCNGSKNHPFVQRALNRINRYLKENGLEVSGEKSELMHVLGPGRRPRKEDLPTYRIDDQTIKPKNKIKILGVTITEQLLLDTEEEDMTARLDKARKLLRHLSINRIVMNNLEWNTLFEAYLKSLLIHNFIPLLALDSRAR